MEVKYNWFINSYEQDKVEAIAKDANISLTLAALLVQRGINNKEELRLFFNAGMKELSDPWKFKDMSKTVDRIKQGIANEEKVVIYGDYDVDGVCSIVILKKCLEFIGLNADYYVPNRFDEGYGLNAEAIKQLAEEGYSLIITVDCGISAHEEINLAKELGLDIIITDHHTHSEELPLADAILNPKTETGIEQNLSGAGVVFYLARALLETYKQEDKINSFLDLVALATIADVVPLLGDNRILVREGLAMLDGAKRIGIKALLIESAIFDKKLQSWHIGYILAPRINSAGRMQDASISIELLLCEDKSKAMELAEKLCLLNEERKKVEEEITREAIVKAEEIIQAKNAPILIIDGESWHEGVIGIVASRLVDKYHCPAIVLSWQGDKGRASGRSVDGVDLFEIVENSATYCEGFGGHKMAVGLSIKRENFPDFKASVLQYLHETQIPAFVSRKKVDIEIDCAEIDLSLLNEIKKLEPFGEGNPEPCFLLRNSQITQVILLGKKKEHIKFKIGSQNIEAIAFNKSEYMNQIKQYKSNDILFAIQENDYNGQKEIQLKINDIKASYLPDISSDLKSLKANQRIDIFKRVFQELAANKMVLFIYPSARSLKRQELYLDAHIPEKLLHKLYGNQARDSREESEELLSSAYPGVYLISQAYLRYYLRKKDLPANLSYIVVLCPEDLPDNIWESIKKHEVEVEHFYPSQILNYKRTDDIKSLLDKSVVYTNRKSTIEQVSTNIYDPIVEAGINDYTLRERLRKEFEQNKKRTFFSDGVLINLYGEISEVEKIILADAPFGKFEIISLYNQVAASRDIELYISFKESDIENNKQYLNGIFPDISLIKATIAYFQKRKYSHIIENELILANALGKEINKQIKPWNLYPILHILVDLGLCQMKKQGSMIEIKFLAVQNSQLDISNSPYYLEGIEEKNSLDRFCEEIREKKLW